MDSYNQPFFINLERYYEMLDVKKDTKGNITTLEAIIKEIINIATNLKYNFYTYGESFVSEYRCEYRDRLDNALYEIYYHDNTTNSQMYEHFMLLVCINKKLKEENAVGLNCLEKFIEGFISGHKCKIVRYGSSIISISIYNYNFTPLI